ncbi:Glycosyltransferase [Synechococcus sp. RCC307]|nr:Glycosyltransferase [Synechococcus sp. RCC307]
MNITIILPVYGNSPWLKEAVESVVNQNSNSWKLLIADDGSDEITRRWLRSKLNKLQDARIQWILRPKNLGLFRNLNQAIKESITDWVLLLCSDDKLHPNAITSLELLQQSWPQVGLILSSFDSINANGSPREPDSSQHHDQLRVNTGLVAPEKMVPGLLRLGSLNGNLTGMAFSKEHWQNSGPFREDWRHAADWEWLIRASETKAVLLNRNPIASVRTHGGQLSVRNRQSGHECKEIADVIAALKRHPLLQGATERERWAGHVMQFQLWNLIKASSQGEWSQLSDGLKAIHNSAGLRQTGRSLLRWMPARWKRWIGQNAR